MNVLFTSMMWLAGYGPQRTLMRSRNWVFVFGG